MLSAKPWRADALIRLFASVLICVIFLSATVTSALHLILERHDHSLGYWFSTVGACVFLGAALFVLRRTWALEQLARTLAMLLICVYAGFFLMWLAARFHGETEHQLVSTTVRIVVAVLCFQGASLLLIRSFVREHGLTWREAFGFDKRPKQAIALGVVAGLIAVPVTGGLQILSSSLLERIGIHTPEQEAVQVLRASATWFNRLVLGITAILIAPLAEEILFRGILYPAIKRVGYPRLAVVITALLFSVIHVNLGAFIPLAVFAVGLAWLYERTDNLATAITAHSVFNTVNFVMLFVVESIEHLPVPE